MGETVTVTRKECKRCTKREGRTIVKGATQFYRNRGSPDGLTYYCKDCENDRKRERAERNKDEATVATPKIRRTPPPQLQLDAPLSTPPSNGNGETAEQAFMRGWKAHMLFTEMQKVLNGNPAEILAKIEIGGH